MGIATQGGTTRGRIAALGLAMLLGACATPHPDRPGDAVSRGIAADDVLDSGEVAGPTRSYSVADISVVVPRSLRVSERNSFYPGGDIVWREDPIGDRHAQVETIMRDGLQNGVEAMAGMRPVALDVEVVRFHAVTEKARYTVGGVHAIQFDLTVRDAETGEIIEPTRRIRADFQALGGSAAIAAENRGITQKKRIMEQLAHVIRKELTTTDGYRPQNTGLFGLINQL